MEGGLLDCGEGKERTQAGTAAAGATSHSLGEFISCYSASLLVLASIAYAALVLYVTDVYAHSWIERLQMLPLCIVAVTAPMLWAIMFRKFHG